MAKALFNKDDVIDKAIELFWQNGFSASSMQQVVKTTGLQPGSIYHAFGNKEGLFRQALERYAKKSLTRVRTILDSAPSVGAGICTILNKMVEDSTKEKYSGCFLIKTELELAMVGNELHKFTTAKLVEIEALYQSYLEKEVSEMLSRQRASSLMLHIFGIRVYGYQQDSADRIHQGLRAGLPWLPWR